MPEHILMGTGGASESTLAALLAELQTKLDAGGTVALDAATVTALTTALEQVTATIANLPDDYPDADTHGALASLLAAVQALPQITQTDALTNTQLRASAVPVAGTVTVANPTAVGLTDTQLRATPVPVSGTVTITDGAGPVSVDGTVAVSNLPTPQTDALTNTQLRASAVPVSGPVTDAQLRATAVPVSISGTTPALTNTQLRASGIRVIDEIAYYASATGGRVAFNLTSGLVSIGATGEQNLAAFVNPAGSGEDLYIHLGEFGSSQNATFRRYRNSTITPTGTPNQPNNMGGGSAVSAARMYPGGAAPTYTRTGGVVSKTAHIAAYQQYLTTLKGLTILRPGQNLAWSITNAGGGISTFTASVFVEFWVLPAAA